MALQTKNSFNSGTKLWNIKVDGEIDVATAADLRKLLTDMYQETQADIVLDMTDLCYIDSTGLGVLIGAYGRMHEEGYGVHIVNPRENIAKLLRITSLDKIFCNAE